MIMYTVAEDHMGDTEIAQVYSGCLFYKFVEVIMSTFCND